MALLTSPPVNSIIRGLYFTEKPRRDLGIDIKPSKVQEMLQAGYDCIQGDVTQLDLLENSVRFVVMSHVLEHLPNLEAVRAAIANAARVGSDFLFIQGPYFDADKYLRSLERKGIITRSIGKVQLQDFQGLQNLSEHLAKSGGSKLRL